MKWSERILWAAVIVTGDTLILVVPVMAVVTAYVLFAKPLWFKQWVDRIYA